jgi:hypothetical protein
MDQRHEYRAAPLEAVGQPLQQYVVDSCLSPMKMKATN